MRGGRDVSAFSEFYAEYDAASGLGKRLGNRIVVNGPLTYSAQQVSRDIANLKAGAAKVKENIHRSRASSRWSRPRVRCQVPSSNITKTRRVF